MTPEQQELREAQNALIQLLQRAACRALDALRAIRDDPFCDAQEVAGEALEDVRTISREAIP